MKQWAFQQVSMEVWDNCIWLGKQEMLLHSRSHAQQPGRPVSSQ